MEMLTLSHVGKHFGTRQVLKDVSFHIPAHTVFGFVGQNGAGKTTTMKLILGLLKADHGKILVNGEPVHYGNTTTNRLIGYLPDVPEFYSFLTPMEYLHFCGEVTGMNAREITTRSEEMLRLVGLERENRRIRGFSRGMKQRLGVAQALLNRPKLLICDEPTSALDPAGRKELLEILVTAKEQTTVLFSTHILSDVEHICDELAFLHDGKIALNGSLSEVKKIRRAAAVEMEMERWEDVPVLKSRFAFLESSGRNRLRLNQSEKLPEIMHFLADRKIPIQKIERLEPTLEDLFMEVIGK